MTAWRCCHRESMCLCVFGWWWCPPADKESPSLVIVRSMEINGRKWGEGRKEEEKAENEQEKSPNDAEHCWAAGACSFIQQCSINYRISTNRLLWLRKKLAFLLICLHSDFWQKTANTCSKWFICLPFVCLSFAFFQITKKRKSEDREVAVWAAMEWHSQDQGDSVETPVLASLKRVQTETKRVADSKLRCTQTASVWQATFGETAFDWFKKLFQFWRVHYF